MRFIADCANRNFLGVDNLVGLPKDLTTEHTEITEKNL